MRCARTGPTPGRASSSAAVALFRSSLPPGAAAAAPPGAGADAPGAPTTICWPSVTRAARLTNAGSASGPSPPAASTAAATRGADGSVTSPGRAAEPTTETTTVAEVSATSPTAGCRGALLVDALLVDAL